MNRLAVAALAATAIVVGCAEDEILEPRTPVASVRMSASLSGPSTANATVTHLAGVAGFAGHVALAVNGSGRAVGYAGSQNPAVSFEPATVLYPETVVDGVPEGALVASGINDAGVISGRGFRGQFGGVFAGPGPDGWLPMLPGGFNQLGGYINNAGEVVGVTFFDPLNTSPGHATLWVPGPSGYSAVDLGTFNAAGIEESIEPSALAPNLSGASRIIVGNRSVRGAGTTLGVMWRNGEWIELGMQTALDVADNGIVVGGSDAGLWENGRLRNLHPECLAAGGSPGGHSIARGIALTPTGRVLIVGRCGEDPAVWYSDGNGGYICELLPLLAGDSRGDAFDVNPSGQIVGYTQPDQSVSPGVAHAVRWQFTPPPVRSDNRPPDARITGPTAALEGSTVTISGSGSTDPDGDALTYSWKINGVAAGAAPTVTYAAEDGPASVTFELRVTDPLGASHATTHTLTVSNVAPTVTAAPNDSEIFSGDVFTPTADFSDPGRLDSPWTSEIDWGFGDTERVQRLAQGPFTMSKRYLRAGRYTVGVGVTDKDGGRGDASLNLLVKRLPVSVLVWPNPITLGRRDFGVVVAIVLSTDRVDATTIDPATATLGDERGQEAAAVNLRDVAWQTSTGDANGDGRADMVLTFRKADLQANGDLTAATSQLILLADLAGGRQIRGVGATRVVP